MSRIWKGLPLVIFGTSGHAREIAGIIEEINSQQYVKVFDFLGFVGKEDHEIGCSVGTYNIVASDNTFDTFKKNFDCLGVVVSQTSPKIKKKILSNLNGYDDIVYPNIISPKANINEKKVQLGFGNVIAMNVIITDNVKLGNFNLINRAVNIGHDTIIKSNVVINPMACISGNVTILDDSLIGASSVLMQNIKIGKNVKIGIGSIIIKDIASNKTMIGNAARFMESEYE